jgi:hypothetical protein
MNHNRRYEEHEPTELISIGVVAKRLIAPKVKWISLPLLYLSLSLSLLSLKPIIHFLSPPLNYLSIQTLCDPTFLTAYFFSGIRHHHCFPAKTISNLHLFEFPIKLKMTVLSSKTFHT